MGGRTWISLPPDKIQHHRVENQVNFYKAEFQTISLHSLADITVGREGRVSSALIPSQKYRKRGMFVIFMMTQGKTQS